MINHKDVIGWGALNTDLIYEIESIESLRSVFSHVESGGEYFVDADEKFSSLQALLKKVGKLKVQSGGGQAANTITALTRMGFKTGFIGKVGRDAYGDFLLHGLNEVDTSGIVREGKSGVCLIVVDKNKERTNFVIPNCNDTLNETDIDLNYIANSTFLHLSSFVGTEPLEAQKKILESIPPNVKVSFDPGELYCRKGLKELLPIVERSYVIFLTEREIRYLLGLDYNQGSRELLDCGPSIVVCKQGSEGSLIFTEKETIEMPAQEVQAVDTTGAGDVYAAGFLAGLLLEATTEECTSFATKAASLSVTGFGREKYPDVEYRRTHLDFRSLRDFGSLKLGWFSTGRDKAALDLFETIEDYIKKGIIHANIEYVFSDRERGESKKSDHFFDVIERYNRPLICFSSKKFKPSLKKKNRIEWRKQFDGKVVQLLESQKVDLIMLAGYMLIVNKVLLDKWPLINLHPAKPGGPKGIWQDVMWELIKKGEDEAGAMIHLVTEQLDEGPPLTYCSFPIRGGEFDVLWEQFDEKLKRKSFSAIIKEEGEQEPLFKKIREEELSREFPLIIVTLQKLAEGHIKITDKQEILVDGVVSEEGLCVNEFLTEYAMEG